MIDQEQIFRRISDLEVLVSKYHNQLQKYTDKNVNYNQSIVPRVEFEYSTLAFMSDLDLCKAAIQGCKESIGAFHSMIQDGFNKIYSDQKMYRQEIQELQRQITGNAGSLQNMSEYISKLEGEHNISMEKIKKIEEDLVIHVEYFETHRQSLDYLHASVESLKQHGASIEDKSLKLSNNAIHVEQSRIQDMDKFKGAMESQYKAAWDAWLKLKADSLIRLQDVHKRIDELPKPEKKEIDLNPMLDEMKLSLIDAINMKMSDVSVAFDRAEEAEKVVAILSKRVNKVFDILNENKLIK